jgi:hypothetical protein
VQKIFSYCTLYGPCIICVYSMLKPFLCYLYSILKKYLSVVSSCFCVVFILFLLLDLFVCFVYLWLIPHPIIVIKNLRIRGMYVCVCAHFHFSFIHPYTHLLNKIYVAAGMILMTFERWISVFPTLFFTRFVLKNVICKFYF